MRLALVIIAASLVLFGVQSRSETALERGRYLVDTIASCGNCHTPKGPNGPLPGKKLAGGDVIKHRSSQTSPQIKKPALASGPTTRSLWRSAKASGLTAP